MTLKLTFLESLLLSLVILTTIYTVTVLLLRIKESDIHHVPKQPMRIVNRVEAILFSLILLSLIVVAMFLSYNKTNLWYRALYTVITLTLSLFVVSIRHHIGVKLLLVLIFHVATLTNSWSTYQFPPPHVIIGERTVAFYMTMLEGHWNPEWKLLNPTYDPLPGDVVIHVFLHYVTNVDLLGPVTYTTLITVLIMMFDITLYLIIRFLIRDEVVALLTLIILAQTPPLNLSAHVPRSLALLLILLCIYKLLSTRTIGREVFMFTLIAYTAAIFYHITSMQIVIILLSPLLVELIGKHLYISRLSNDKLSNEVRYFTLNRRRLLLILMLMATIATVKTSYVYGAASQLIKPLEAMIKGILNLKPAPEYAAPNYQHSVDPIYAYTWSNLPALATASAILYVIYFIKYFVKGKRAGSVEGETLPIFIGLYVSSGALALLGLLSAYTGVGIHPDIYPALVFLAPIASKSLMMFVKSNINRQISVPIMFMLCFVIQPFIAISDPMLSVSAYNEMKLAVDVPPRVSNWYTDAMTISSFFQEGFPYKIYATYEFMSYAILEARIKSYHIESPGGADVRRKILYDLLNYNIEPEYYKYLFIWPSWWPSIPGNITVSANVFYNSQRYMAFSLRGIE